MPMRIQRQRLAGWTMPKGAKYVGRPTIYGNSFGVGHDDAGWHVQWTDWEGQQHKQPTEDQVHAHLIAVDRYCTTMGEEMIEQIRRELPGLDLACWCHLDLPCHADALLFIAAGETPYRYARRARLAYQMGVRPDEVTLRG